MPTSPLKSSEANRNATLRRVALLVDQMLRGKTYDRHSAATLLGLTAIGADRQLKVVATMKGMSKAKDGQTTVYRFNANELVGAPHPSTLIAACFGSSLWRLFQGTVYEEGMRDVLSNLLKTATRRSAYGDIDRKFRFIERGGEVSLRRGAGVLDVIVDALLSPTPLTLTYEGFKGTKKNLVVEPLSIAVYEHQLYLLARPRGGGAVHTYRLSRIRAAKEAKGTFRYPTAAEYDPAKLFEHSFGIFIDPAISVQHLRVRLHPRWRRHVRTHRWHASQTVTDTGKELYVEMDVRICPEVEAWVMSMGEEAEVLEPKALRAKVAKRVKEMAVRYRWGPKAGAPR